MEQIDDQDKLNSCPVDSKVVACMQYFDYCITLLARFLFMRSMSFEREKGCQRALQV
ncbi:hypothetical protein GF325_04390 [Candidatus Bathyarchaeota archaeon]|nr:hypothetical protein [Candidatus Bathyarchaeota archaeon]